MCGQLKLSLNNAEATTLKSDTWHNSFPFLLPRVTSY